MRSSTMTVYFEGPFWVAVLERTDGPTCQVARVVLGSEPTDTELFHFLAENHDRFRFEEAQGQPTPRSRLRSGKAATREARREAQRGLDDQALQALSKARQERRAHQKTLERRSKREELDRLRDHKVQQKKERHRGH